LREPVDTRFLGHGVELALDGPVEEEVGLDLFGVLDGFVPQGLNKGLSLGAVMLTALQGSRGARLEPGIEVDALHGGGGTRYLAAGRFLVALMLFLRGGGWV
jgi:hypothetical protein